MAKKHPSEDSDSVQTNELLKGTSKNIFNLLWSKFKKSSFIWGPQLNDVGLNLGHRNVIAVELDKTEEIPQIVNFGAAELSADNPNIAEVVQNIFSSHTFSNNLVNTAISGKSIIVRFIKLPKMQKKEMTNSLAFEAEKYIPFDLSQVYLGFDVLDSADNKKMSDVALVAAKKDAVDDVVSLCKNAGLVVKIIDIDSFACLNAFLHNYPEERTGTVALLNVGAKLTNLMIASNGKPEFCRDIYFGGDDVTQALVKKLEIGKSEADVLKLNLGEATEEVKSVVRETIEYLVTEVKLSFDYFSSQNQGKKAHIDAIYLIGGSSRLEGMSSILSSKLEVDAHNFDPLRGFTVSDNVDKSELDKCVLSLAVPLGLALRA